MDGLNPFSNSDPRAAREALLAFIQMMRQQQMSQQAGQAPYEDVPAAYPGYYEDTNYLGNDALLTSQNDGIGSQYGPNQMMASPGFPQPTDGNPDLYAGGQIGGLDSGLTQAYSPSAIGFNTQNQQGAAGPLGMAARLIMAALANRGNDLQAGPNSGMLGMMGRRNSPGMLNLNDLRNRTMRRPTPGALVGGPNPQKAAAMNLFGFPSQLTDAPSRPPTNR